MFYNIWIVWTGKELYHGKEQKKKSGQFMDKTQDGQKYQETYGLL